MIRLWRDKPVSIPIKSGDVPVPIKHIFPSGRQALSHSLQIAGLGRNDKVAIPEWSSHCVISAVGKVANPIPMIEVAKYNITVDAILIYEQWGWPIPETVMNKLGKIFEDKILIHDIVDSAHFKFDGYYNKLFNNVYSIISLSKILGLPGGGIALANGHQLEYKSDIEFEEYLKEINKLHYSTLTLQRIINNYKKSEISALSNDLKSWFKNNNLLSSIEYELEQRQKNVVFLLESSFTTTWPAWMKNAIKNGAGPGIAPLFRGKSDLVLMNNQKKLKKELGIESSIYHFNWSGDPLLPNYEKCLAIPVHGLVYNINKIVTLL